MAATSITIDCHAPCEPRWFELFVSPRGDRLRRGATVMLLPSPVGGPLPAVAPGGGHFPDVPALHAAVVRRLTAVDRLIHAMQAAPTDEQIDQALSQVDAAIVALQRAADEIDAERP